MRTDRTNLCAACAVRFSQTDRCPRCGSTQIYSLDLGKSRRNGMRMIRYYQRSPRARAADTALSTWFGIIAPALATAGGILAQSFIVGIFLFAALYSVGGAVAVGLSAAVRMIGGASGGPAIPRILLYDPSISEAAQRVVVRGIARPVELVRAPLSGEMCIAYRLLGRGPTGEIDEAGAGVFEIEGDPEGSARVEAATCSVNIPVTATPRAIGKQPALVKYLRERGACPHLGNITLAEARIAPGAFVEVEGSASLTPEAKGYRDTGFRRLMRDAPGSPLILRLPPPALPASTEP